MFAGLIAKLRAAQEYAPGPVALHAPVFHGREREYVMNAIDSTFVSSVGEYVDLFEQRLAAYTGVKRAVVCVNGTSALEIALRTAGVRAGELVITQAVSFVATANAIVHAGAEPVFVDIDRSTLGLSPDALRDFLEKHCSRREDGCLFTANGKKIAACVPMHTFGLPCAIAEIAAICGEWGIPLVEDAAESLGSTCNGRHCGTFGLFGCLSFNGNKIVTTGGGGAVITNNEALGARIKHLTTQAKIPHPWEYAHDAAAWNFRLPNINAALGCAQLEQIEDFVAKKTWRAARYAEALGDTPWTFVPAPPATRPNWWLCAVLFNSQAERDAFLEESNAAGFMTRPIWRPLNRLEMYAHCLCGDLTTTNIINERLVNLPSGVGQ